MLPLLVLLATMPSAVLDGKPFPEPIVYTAPIPAPKRIVYVKPEENLQAALNRLEPGDRLVMLPGNYPGSITLGIECRDGNKDAFIQVVAEPGAVLRPTSQHHGLTIHRSFWIIDGLEIIPGNHKATAVIVRTVDAHDVILNRLHLHDGPTKGISVGSGAHRVTIANSHIHHLSDVSAKRKSFGIKIYPHARDITVVANDIHHIGGSGIKLAAPEAPEGLDLGGGPPAHARGKSKEDQNDSSQTEGPGRGKGKGKEQGERDDEDEDEAEQGARPNAPSRSTRTRWGPPQDRKEWSRHVSLLGNRIHENEDHAIDLGGYENVLIESNVLWGYSARGRLTGAAIFIDDDASNISIQKNHIADSTIAIRLGVETPFISHENKPESISISRNFFESGTIAFDIHSGRDIRIHNNVIDRFATAFTVRPRPQEIEIANNIVLRSGDRPFVVASADSLSLFDYNAFSSDSPAFGRIGSQMRELKQWVQVGNMPNTRVKAGLALAGDLATVTGMSTSDAGKALRGIKYEGKAPDLGIAEHGNAEKNQVPPK